jgi:hypothetical protein
MICTLHKILGRSELEKDRVGGAYIVHIACRQKLCIFSKKCCEIMAYLSVMYQYRPIISDSEMHNMFFSSIRY